jgi:hypothetical protein
VGQVAVDLSHQIQHYLRSSRRVWTCPSGRDTSTRIRPSRDRSSEHIRDPPCYGRQSRNRSRKRRPRAMRWMRRAHEHQIRTRPAGPLPQRDMPTARPTRPHSHHAALTTAVDPPSRSSTPSTRSSRIGAARRGRPHRDRLHPSDQGVLRRAQHHGHPPDRHRQRRLLIARTTSPKRCAAPGISASTRTPTQPGPPRVELAHNYYRPRTAAGNQLPAARLQTGVTKMSWSHKISGQVFRCMSTGPQNDCRKVDRVTCTRPVG